MAQYALPISDVAKEFNWLELAGDGDASAFDELDEGFGAGRGSGSGPDDATTAWRENQGTGATAQIIMRLGAVTDPSSSSGHIYRTRNRKSAAGGKTVDLVTRLYQNGSEIRNDSVLNINEVWTTRAYTLSSTEADSITDYSLLEISSEFNISGSGAGRQLQESAMEFECPDVATFSATSAVAPVTQLSSAGFRMIGRRYV